MKTITCLFKMLKDWVTNLSPAILTIGIGLFFVLLAVLGSFDISGLVAIEEGKGSLKFESPHGGISPVLVYGLFAIGIVLLLLGTAWCFFDWKAKQARLQQKRVIVVETRGLRDTSGRPLVEMIPKKFSGHRESVLIDLRQGILDGEIFEPYAGIEKVASLPSELQRRENGLDRKEITLAYGGLSPVPFTFLTGVLIDDESPVLLFDWDRHAENWRELDGADDGLRFTGTGLRDIATNTREVALAVSVSYRILVQDVRAKTKGIPLVALDLDGRSIDCHWSEEKQRSLGVQFLNTVVELGNKGVDKIHLFLAAPNSLVFRFGRLYDKRNLPSIVVYQYQRAETPPHTWGILMPVGGINKPEVIWERTIKQSRSRDSHKA